MPLVTIEKFVTLVTSTYNFPYIVILATLISILSVSIIIIQEHGIDAFVADL